MSENQADELHDYLVGIQDACRILGGPDSPVHPSTLYRGIAAGRYPKALKIGANSNRWWHGELKAVVKTISEAR